MVIDSHMHCGIQNSDLPLSVIRSYLDDAGIEGACLIPPVEDIYDRGNYHFQDNKQWMLCREQANNYLLDIQKRDPIYGVYFFVWNDFRKDQLKDGYLGIKWHRHEYEPTYNYDDPRCEEFLQEAYRLQLPIMLEESYKNTRYFLKRVAGRTPVIIPHMGGLNGGFDALFQAGIWDDESVYADTALASTREMAQFLEKYGSSRLLFGSDFPFGTPYHELQKIEYLKLAPGERNDLVQGNVRNLLFKSSQK